jgi:hypothetical protein
MVAVRETRRFLALFCVALCLALSAQMTVVMLDRLKHALDIDHPATVLAGPIEHGHDEDLSHGHGHGDALAEHSHGEDAPAHDHSQPVAHHHQGDGMLTPWLAAPTFVFAGLRIVHTTYPNDRHGRPDVAERRRDRPPKLLLERVA